MKMNRRHFFYYWMPVIALCLAIFVESCFPTPPLGPSFPMKDKVLHILAYGLLAILFCRASRITWPERLSPMQLLVISVLFATLYGATDEFHQSFVAARTADVLDGLADFMGSILGTWGYMTLIAKRGIARARRS
jgi:VanZ family protein